MSLEKPLLNRDYFIDNLKFILISLVVIGHFIEPYTNQNAFIYFVFLSIYTFHMPLFVFISGYLSKSEKSIKPHLMVYTVLIPYIFFSVVWEIVTNKTNNALNLISGIVSSSFHLWYLLSLFTWRLLLPVFKTIKHYVAVSILIALLIGLDRSIGNSFSLSRTFSLYPFFLLGYICSSATLKVIHNKKYLIPFCLIFLFAFSYFSAFKFNHPQTIFFWSSSYNNAGLSNFQGIVFRLVLMLASTVAGFGIIALTPSKNHFFTYIGARTITIYIFHPFILKFFKSFIPTFNESAFKNLMILIFPFILIYLLSLPLVNKAYNKLVSIVSNIVINTKTAV